MIPADAVIFEGNFRFGAGTSFLSWQQTWNLQAEEPQPSPQGPSQLRGQQGQPQMEQ